MELGLNNKRALVCGSSQGIGKATALALAAEGACVTLFARNEDSLKSVLREMPNSHRHNYLIANFSNPEEVREAVSKHIAQHGGFHILINNTGGPKSGTLAAAIPSELETAFRMHVVCNQILVQAVLPFMKSEGFGRIINIISTSVKEPIEGLGVSNTIRNAVANWSKSLATELAAFGITVNNVLPGFTETERLNSIISIKATQAGATESDMAQMMRNYVPAKRFGRADEVANAITFLSGETASYITGINLPVDGGRTKSL